MDATKPPLYQDAKVSLGLQFNLIERRLTFIVERGDAHDSLQEKERNRECHVYLSVHYLYRLLIHPRKRKKISLKV